MTGNPSQASGERLAERARLAGLGLRSGQRFRFEFERDPRKDRVIDLGYFEEPSTLEPLVFHAPTRLPPTPSPAPWYCARNSRGELTLWDADDNNVLCSESDLDIELREANGALAARAPRMRDALDQILELACTRVLNGNSEPDAMEKNLGEISGIFSRIRAIACKASVDEIPVDYSFKTTDTTGCSDVDVRVPPSMIELASRWYRLGGSIVIAEFFNGEDYLLYLDDQIPEDCGKLVDEGWPLAFVEFLTKQKRNGNSYVRILS